MKIVTYKVTCPFCWEGRVVMRRLMFLRVLSMAIKSFSNKGVEEVLHTGRSRRIGPEFHQRMKLSLSTCSTRDRGVRDLRGARGFHVLQGARSGTFAMAVSGNWRLTFRFEHGDAGDIHDVDFEDYH